jgi:hypothetical protein
MNRRNAIKSIVAAAGGIALLGIPSVAAAVQLRKVETLVSGGWGNIPWQQLKKGDIFRLVNPDGSLADEGTIREVCTALSDAEPAEVGVWSVQCDPCGPLDAVIAGREHGCVPIGGTSRIAIGGH